MFKRISSVLMSFLLSFSYLAVLTPATTFAAADVCTWTGGGADANFSTALNWDCTIDVLDLTGDAIVFDSTSVDFTVKHPIVDIPGYAFTDISFTMDDTDNDGVDLSGEDFSLSGDIFAPYYGLAIDNNITLTALSSMNMVTLNGSLDIGANTLELASYPTFNGIISGSGDINILAGTTNFNGNNNFTGNIAIADGSTLTAECGVTSPFGTTAGSTTVSSGGVLNLSSADKATIAEPIVLAGTGTEDFGALRVRVCRDSSEYGSQETDARLKQRSEVYFTLSDVTLSADAVVDVYSMDTLKLTGAALGGHKLTLTDDSGGALVVNGAATKNKPKNTTIDKGDTAPGYGQPFAYDGGTITLNGEASSITIYSGATLKGAGDVTGVIFAYPGSIVSIGNSPGCMTSGWINFTDATFQVEVAGDKACSEYDQLQVESGVYLFDPILDVTFLDDYEPEEGTEFTIIDHDGEGKIRGTFKDLEEGATFELDGYVLSVSYEGGDGNDVVLTVDELPTTPDTGFSLAGNNPIATLMATTLLAGAMLATSRKYAKATVKK
jgi:hypothetical protein